jgi:hypothetical protein
MYDKRLFSLEMLENGLGAILPELIRFPALKPDVLQSRVDDFIQRNQEVL